MSAAEISPAEALQKLQLTKEIAAAIMRGSNIDSVSATKFRKLGCSDELLARLNMSEAVIRGPELFRDPLAKGNHITGKVGGRPGRPKPISITWENVGIGSNQPNLMYPASRPSRPIGNRGGRSFHMKETIAYTTPTASQSAAKARHDYALDASKVPIVEAQLAGSSLEHGLYLYRDKVKVEREGLRLAVTSMGPDDEMVISQWQLIAETETRRVGKPILPHITIDKAESPDDGFWDRLCSEPDVPASLQAFLRDEGSTAITFVGDDFKPLECFLRKHGWHHRAKGKTRDDVKFHQGRNVIAQRRLVFELPAELSLEAVERIIHDLGKEFHKRELPFVLVVHRPDDNNHEKNWHIHLDYHHRPMQRFDPATYILPPLSEDPGKKTLAQRAILEKALANPNPEWIGKWDAEIPYEYRTDCGRKKVAYPFVQDDHPDTRDDNWLKNLRKRFAEIINGELEREQSATRFDPRRLDEQEIGKFPDEHLGLKQSYLERTGKPTKVGAQNEQNQWDYEHSELLKKYPGGNKVDGKPEIVAGYVSDCMKLIHVRLQSRAKFVSYFARRQADSDRQVNPTPTTRRRNRRQDYRFEQLADLADKTLANINEVWTGISSWAEGLDVRLLAHAEQAQFESKVKDSGCDPKPEQLAPRGASNNVAAGITSRTQSGPVPQPPSSLGTTDVPASKKVSGPSAGIARPSSFEMQIALLREHDIHFEIGRQQLPDGRWALAAKLNKADALQHALPQHVISRGSDEKNLLMLLDQERSRRRQKNNPADQVRPACLESGQGHPATPVVEELRDQAGAKAFVFDAVFSRDKRSEPTREAGELPAAGYQSADPGSSNMQIPGTSVAKPSIGGQNSGIDHDTGGNAQINGTADPRTDQLQPGQEQGAQNDPAIALVQRAKRRDILVIPLEDGGLMVRGAREGSRVLAVEDLSSRAAEDLMALAAAHDEELSRLGNFIAQNTAGMQQTGWRERLHGSEGGAEISQLFTSWSTNADFQRAMAKCMTLPKPDRADAEDQERRRKVFALLLLDRADANALIDEIARRAVPEEVTRKEGIDPHEEVSAGRTGQTRTSPPNETEKDQSAATGPVPRRDERRPDRGARSHELSRPWQQLDQGWGR